MDMPNSDRSMHEYALQLALKEVLARQPYTGVVPMAPTYTAIAQRALEIELAITQAAQPTERRDR